MAHSDKEKSFFQAASMQDITKMEELIQEKYGNFTEYHPFMDDNMGLWANELDSYIEAFQVINHLVHITHI